MSGALSISAASAAPAVLNRTTSEGDIVDFQYAGSTAGKIGISSGYYVMGDGVSGLLYDPGTPSIMPFTYSGNQLANCTISLGTGSAKWNVFYVNDVHTGALNINSAIEFPTADGSANQVLQTNGSGVLSFVDQAGADLYAANESSPTAQPSATGTNAIAIGDSAVSTGTGSVAVGKSRATGANSFAAGSGNSGSSYGAQSSNSIALGSNALVTSTSYHGVAIGENAACRSERSIAVGNYASVGTTANGSFAGMGTVNNACSNSVAIKGNTQANSSVAIGRNSVASGTYGIALGNSLASGTDSVGIGITNNTSTYGSQGNGSIAIGTEAKSTAEGSVALGEGTVASGTLSAAIGAGADATAIYSIAIGRLSDATATRAFSIGYGSTASGTDAYAFGKDATASGTNSVALGPRSSATASSSLSICTSYANYGNASSGLNSITIGDGNAASATSSIAIGYGANAATIGKFVYASGSFSDGNAEGSAQGGQFILRADTTDATATVLTTNNSTASSNNQIVAASDTCITFDGTITAMQNGAQAYASWRIEGLLVNDGGTTTLANSATTIIDNQSSWGMALSADNTNNALAITCTGEASHNIRWVANIRTTEVTYA